MLRYVLQCTQLRHRFSGTASVIMPIGSPKGPADGGNTLGRGIPVSYIYGDLETQSSIPLAKSSLSLSEYSIYKNGRSKRGTLSA